MKIEINRRLLMQFPAFGRGIIPSRTDLAITNAYGPLGSREYLFATLAPNKIFLAETSMDQWAWFQLSLDLCMSQLPADYAKARFERFAERVQNRRGIKGLDGAMIKTVLPDPRLNSMLMRMEEQSFAEGAVWQLIKRPEVMPGWKTRLPIPRPRLTYGYCGTAFAPSALVVQWSIMPQKSTGGLDLASIFQPITGLFWPFLVVEIACNARDEPSMVAAKHAAASTAASCLTGARVIINAFEEDAGSGLAGVPAGSCYDAARVFSVSIASEKAALSMHTFDGDEHTMTEIRTFDLRDADELRQLRAQMDGVLSWAKKNRLPLIQRLLNWFGKYLQVKAAFEPSKILTTARTSATP